MCILIHNSPSFVEIRYEFIWKKKRPYYISAERRRNVLIITKWNRIKNANLIYEPHE
jgi:hypothetical protein